MDQAAQPADLAPFAGTWSIEATFEGAPSEPAGRVTFEWLAGGPFLLERWQVDHPDAPDGVAVIRFDPGRQTYLQHYFDSRGVARVYAMTVSDGVWKMWRDAPDYSPLDFHQRFEGAFSADGKTITGRWEISDDGTIWKHDFDLTYRKLA